MARRFHPVGPFQQRRHEKAPFVDLPFVTAPSARGADTGHRAVIAAEPKNGVLADAEFADLLSQASEGPVHRRDLTQEILFGLRQVGVRGAVGVERLERAVG